MDNRPIGFFDSGIGGLTSVKNVMRDLPDERIIFFGDTARTPYGSKAQGTIIEFSLQIAEFLVNQGVKMIVIACNTVSAVALDVLRSKYPDIHIIGVIAPTSREAVKLHRPDERMGIIATKATTKTGAYGRKIKKLASDIHIFSKACPAFVPLIEEGIIDNQIMDLTIKYYLDDFIWENKLDTLILGCTHYPIIEKNIRKIYPDVRIINSSKEVATAVRMELDEYDMFADHKTHDDTGNVFYASDLSENVVEMIEMILGQEKEELNINFKNLDI